MDLGNQCKGGTIVRLQGKKLTVQKNPLGDKEEVVWFGTKAPELQAVYFMKFFFLSQGQRDSHCTLICYPLCLALALLQYNMT